MRRVPSSLVLTVRDMMLLGVVAFVGGYAVTAPAFRRDFAEFVAEAEVDVSDLVWSSATTEARGWALGLLVWLLAVWCASRARAGRRTVWLPAGLAALVVVARSAGSVALFDAGWLLGWPGPSTPLRWNPDGTLTLAAGHPAWAYPPLVVALLVAAAVLGARAGRRPDDRAAHRTTPAPRGGVALACVVVGLPAVGSAAGAVAAWLAGTDDAGVTTGDRLVWFADDVGIPLALALLAAALLSGTGPLGGLATVPVAFPVITAPVMSWMSGGSNTLLGQAAGLAVAVLAVALWRPAAAWGAEVLGPARVPAPGSLPE